MTSMEMLPEFAGFFENAREGRLAFPHCPACDRFHWYPMPRCPHCQNAGWLWRPVSGPGEIHTFTSVRHAFDKSWGDRLPYTVALVTIADAPGVRLITNIVDAAPSDLRIGDPVEPIFPAPHGPMDLIVFRPVARNRREL